MFQTFKEKIKKFFSIGQVSIRDIIQLLFIGGILPLVYTVYSSGMVFFPGGTKRISFIDGNSISYKNVPVQNLVPMVIYTIIISVVGIILWKVICELINIMFDFLKQLK